MKNGVFMFDGVEKEYNYVSDMTALTKAKFVTMVSQLLIGENYLSVLRELVFDFMLIKLMTDVDVSYITDPDNADGISMMEEFVLGTGIAETLKADMREGLLNELNKAVDDNIAYRTGIQKNPIADAIASLVKTLERQVRNIDTGKIMGIAEALSKISGEFTPDNVAKAYMDSSVFKKRQAELIAEREKRDAALDTVMAEFAKEKK